MIPVHQNVYPTKSSERHHSLEINQQEGNLQHQFLQPTAPHNEVYENGNQDNRPKSINTHQSKQKLFEQEVPNVNNVHDPPPPYEPQVISPISHPIPIAIQMPVIQSLPNPNIVINNGNDNMLGALSGDPNGQSPQQIAGLINMQIVKCPFCGLGTFQRSIKYPQLIIFLLITTILFPFGLFVWCCLCCTSLHKRSCTNCGVEA